MTVTPPVLPSWASLAELGRLLAIDPNELAVIAEELDLEFMSLSGEKKLPPIGQLRVLATWIVHRPKGAAHSQLAQLFDEIRHVRAENAATSRRFDDLLAGIAKVAV